MLRFTRRLLVLLNALNWGAAAFCALLLAALLLRLPFLEARLAARHAGHLDLARAFQEAAMLFGLATVVCTRITFVRLIAIVDAVIGGQPFLAANPRRLRDIAWALLGIQLLDLGFGAIAIAYARVLGRTAPWAPGFTGWIAVLLLFVLARIFGQGAAMQDELEGTV